MKIIKYLLIIFGFAFVWFVGWMNLTPGHYQDVECLVEYGMYPPVHWTGLSYGHCPLDIEDQIKLLFANIDFYK